MPPVSVIIPAFNRAQTIGRALRSVLAQDFTDFEIIVVDDASRDGLRAALATVSDRRLTVLSHAENRGAAAARNTGIKAASGQYVAFLDSDDEWSPAKLRTQLAVLKAAQSSALLSFTGFYLRRGGAQPPRPVIPEGGRNAFRIVLGGCRLSPGSTLMCRRALFAEIGHFDENLRRLEDWDWLLRQSRRLEIAVVPELLATVHATPGSAKREDVEAALRTISQRFGPSIRATGWINHRIFRSSILWERAAALFRSGDRAGALRHAARSLALNPRRVLDLLRRDLLSR